MAAAVAMGVSSRNIGRSNAPTRRQQAGAIDVDTIEKDATELRLEQVLFGDDAGFLEALQPQTSSAQALVQQTSGDEAGSDDGDDDQVVDDDLFFLDAGTSDLPAAVRSQLDADADADDTAAGRAVWHDSDDDRVAVSLARNPRLRKLRDTVDDDIVSGREYVARLRRQYERLHPTPDWATKARKRKHLAGAAAADGDDDTVSESDSDVDAATASSRSVQPLAALLRSAGSLTRAAANGSSGLKRRRLQAEVIDIARLPAVASSGPSSVESLHFHPYYPIILASGPSATASLYHISPHPPHPNPLLTSLHVTKTALRHSEFCIPAASGGEDAAAAAAAADGTRIILSSRRRYFHVWSLATGRVTKVSRALSTMSQQQKTTERFRISPCGRYVGLVSSAKAGGGGSINVLDAVTMSWVCTCRIDSQGGVADFDWWAPTAGGAAGFTVVGKSGQVSEYSVAERRTTARWHDEGAVGCTVLANSRDGRWTAIGSSAGITNIYDRHSADFTQAVFAGGSSSTTTTDARPRPARTLDQLTTPVSHLAYSPDAQLLAVGSRWKKNALRLVHLPSCTVFRNWPTDSTSLGRISSVAVGGGSTAGNMLLAVGNERGAIRLWEIRT